MQKGASGTASVQIRFFCSVSVLQSFVYGSKKVMPDVMELTCIVVGVSNVKGRIALSYLPTMSEETVTSD